MKQWDISLSAGYVPVVISGTAIRMISLWDFGAPIERRTDTNTEFRRNVSEQAIGRTFHTIHAEEYPSGTRYWSQWGPVAADQLKIWKRVVLS